MILFIIYIFLGFGEYLRLSEEYREKLYNDFPFHDKLYLELSILTVCLIFGPTLLIMNIFLHTKQFFKNIWKKLTFPFKLLKFRRMMKDVNSEKDKKKSVQKLFQAMTELMK
jgi:hypothetical protein